MIAAASTIDNVELSISGADHRTMELARLLNVRARITPDAVPQEEIRKRLAEMVQMEAIETWPRGTPAQPNWNPPVSTRTRDRLVPGAGTDQRGV